MMKKVIAVSFFSLLLILNSSFSIASEINLPRSGQTLCYDEVGTGISCTGTGQNGAIQAGQPFPSPRFTAANGAVTDNLTGLIWLQNANCSATLGGVAKTTFLTWDKALAWSNALQSGYCGLTDNSNAGEWRLPTKKELQSLVDLANHSPSLPTGHPFTGVQEDFYWSSTSQAVDPAYYAWVVYMSIGHMNINGKSGSSYVWPVRGGQ
jgi:hypothetical protein